jgi:hypothetical protein
MQIVTVVTGTLFLIRKLKNKVSFVSSLPAVTSMKFKDPLNLAVGMSTGQVREFYLT